MSLESREAKKYYDYNKSLNIYMGLDALMITPKVEIIKDENGELLDETVVVSVLTCAAPMVSRGKEGMSEAEYEEMVYNRIMRMLKCVAYLGYAIEFWGEDQIFGTYGEKGITEYKLDDRTGKALISDDTQMSLFTANGLLVGDTRGKMRGIQGWPKKHWELPFIMHCAIRLTSQQV